MTEPDNGEPGSTAGCLKEKPYQELGPVHAQQVLILTPKASYPDPDPPLPGSSPQMVDQERAHLRAPWDMATPLDPTAALSNPVDLTQFDQWLAGQQENLLRRLW